MNRLALSARGFVLDRVEELAILAKHVGITDIELPLVEDWTEGQAQDLKRRLQDEGLRPVVCAGALDFSAPTADRIGRALSRFLSCSQTFGAGLVNLYCCPCVESQTGQARALLVEAVRSRADAMVREGIVMTIENELSAQPNIAGRMNAWLDVTRSVASPGGFRLTLDLANFVAGGESQIARQLRSACPFIGHVHLKDLIPYDKDVARQFPGRQVFQVGENRFLSVPLGMGIVRHAPVMRMLRNRQYVGWLTLESFSDLKGLRKSVEHARPWVG